MTGSVTMTSELAKWPITGEPRGAQLAALAASSHMPAGFAYFKEMGMGKSATLLADYERLRLIGHVDMLVVVCPNTLKSNWLGEIETWMPRPVEAVALPKRVPPTTEMVIMNYEALATGHAPGTALIRDAADKGRRIMLALDESTQIKNPQAARTKALLSLVPLVRFRRILSGAPIVQGIQDVWAQLKFIGGITTMTYVQFRSRYCVMGGYQGKQILGSNPKTRHEVQACMQKHGFRARKSEWLDLPDKLYVSRDIELSPLQTKHYRSMLQEMVVWLDTHGEEPTAVATMVATQLVKLQQITSGWVYSSVGGEPMDIELRDAKSNALMAILQDEVQSKVIVVTYFKHTMARLKVRMDEAGIPFAVIQGGMPADEIAKQKALFNRDGGARVMLVQESSAKYGHTLLGGENDPCHTTVFYENSFSLDDRLQMEDRNHRIGQRYPVTIIDFVATGVDKKIVRALVNKRKLAEEIVDAVRQYNGA